MPKTMKQILLKMWMRIGFSDLLELQINILITYKCDDTYQVSTSSNKIYDIDTKNQCIGVSSTTIELDEYFVSSLDYFGGGVDENADIVN